MNVSKFEGREPVSMIIDADTGIDDALAILYAVKSPAIRLEAVCTVFGNIDVDQATDNTLRLIQLAGARDRVQVVKGASKPLEREFQGSTSHVHGENGIGGAVLPPSDQLPLGEAAADYLVRIANERPGEVTLVLMGRMTNLALALRRDPSIASKFRSVVVMGGNVLVPGNVTPVAEANFWGDPESAAVLMEAGLPLTVIGLDVTLQTLLTRDALDELGKTCLPENAPLVDFLKDSFAIYFDFYQQVNKLDNACPLHDPLAVIAAVFPEMVTCTTLHASIACGDRLTDGMVVTDRRVFPSVGNPVSFALEVDADTALEELYSVFK
ncbi:nucleoside hydrolase [Paenibacillus humicus]|uniref:nucleoside hydrolase n=1 Tax=Paenibacillus humicus TaxID=412861 RepID=UPI000FD8F852|nr:nucleoside hydrolase [Paenibacillus humicus]